ncbi:DUF6339 family protein [Streptomyces sp. TR06-5]|uniref:DNA cytosine methyltransferase n=1 Tax=Streptomyces sp. TR06-5 TaxID=3385976 RepID=UPI0039A27608
MSRLYPRLLRKQALELHREYRELPVEELQRRWQDSHEAAVFVATGGDRVAKDQLRRLRDDVLGLAQSVGFPDDLGRSREAGRVRAEFDLSVAAHLHNSMGVVPAEAASRDLWAFLALVLLPDVAHWRYPNPPPDRVAGTDLTRHVFGRLWWRAQLVHEPGADEPYAALHILGEAAFDQIYARRAALGGSPHMVRAILRVWDDLDLGGLNEREVLRDFLKRLLRLAPFMLFDGLEETVLDGELRAVASEAVAAMRDEDPVPAASVPHSTTVPVARSSQEDGGIADPRPAAGHRSVELCAGAGGQALGLERAGFEPVLLIDTKQDARQTLLANRPTWNVRSWDLHEVGQADLEPFRGVDLVSGGLPRLSTTYADGARTIDAAARGAYEAAVRLAVRLRPRAIVLENLPDLAEDPLYEAVRSWTQDAVIRAGYTFEWGVLNASDFGVPQNRRSGFLVCFQARYNPRFRFPAPRPSPPPTVGEVLGGTMSASGWSGAEMWIEQATRVGPALVGGSDRRGGADLGPTGSKRAWAGLGIDGNSLADEVPGPDAPADLVPKITVEQAALVQGFPTDWQVTGRKTSRYRQIGNALPPAVAEALGTEIVRTLSTYE